MARNHGLGRQKRVHARRDALWGHRPPGTTTWLRGARCTDPEAMPEMEARPPAQNRHGGAPKGAASRSQGTSGRLASARPASVICRPAGCRCTRAPVGAPPTPRSGWSKFMTRAQTRRGNESVRAASGSSGRLFVIHSPIPDVHHRESECAFWPNEANRQKRRNYNGALSSTHEADGHRFAPPIFGEIICMHFVCSS